MKSIATESTAGSSPPGSAQSGPGIDHGVRESFPRFLTCPWGGSGATAWSSVTSLCRWCWDKDGGPHGKKSKIDPEVDVSGSSHKTLNLETACTVNESVNSWEQTVLYEDGRRYKGQWKDGKRHGTGEETSPSGDFSYYGNFSQDRYEGWGRMEWSNGARYCGQFHNNLKHGYGVEQYPNDDVYQGNFVNGRIEGEGTYIRRDGTIVKGLFRDGRLIASHPPSPTHAAEVRQDSALSTPDEATEHQPFSNALFAGTPTTTTSSKDNKPPHKRAGAEAGKVTNAYI
ncbi:unnamed protein product [Vitrella brassicaformis CCMP3155]|uniref:MORN repeat-containing protein n=2 Tax=Vitrella brassicaformis TaxID=1169539 RepID=A0A0G4GAF8_VITBC|nr:unnamed protein product [Vitrella brassicaformis CCMP3155]|mmetsp:Transcript_24464/g.60426  ORF Transcript_24464/g.60426 Transcript_24464/m.60426 type:complete len:285 (+) Transcript_24464:86-940(+)|eukprot:CEM25703.1 unnamed protein product [Vitrella brassicaformis CCMP3155]